MSLGMLLILVGSLVQGALWLVGYLGGNAFPQPLSAEEEAEAIEAMARGDKEARRRLIEHNLRLVAHVVKKYANTGEEQDDLISIGTVGLIKGLDTYDAQKGVRLATYCARCIENELLMHLRNKRKTNREVSLYDPIGVDREGNEISLLDVLGTEAEAVADTVETQVILENVSRFVQELSDKERMVLDLRFGLNGQPRLTQRDVAKRLGISRSYVSRIEKRAVTRILNDLQVQR
ncbi:MAG: RNA polymerase sporulation sigma factor SigK [Firmicutes bacterium]|nr:RNA polymerase sporulation sigma factor SigK [Alicyclobacillaceae bacterium]MCL6496639.1 RNA polymerase sporulation sigma factor SigK [Bacillota bacterium]